MKDFVQTFSGTFIKELLSIDNVYEAISYDGSPKLEEFSPDTVNKVWMVLMQDGRTAGIVLLEPLNNILWTPHIIIFEKYRGNNSEEWGKMIVEHMKKVYGAKKFLALTPYDSAKKYAERIGFEYVATLTNSIKKNGELMDQYMLELE